MKISKRTARQLRKFLEAEIRMYLENFSSGATGRLKDVSDLWAVTQIKKLQEWLEELR